ncbi:MAG: hypothetical protein A2V83_07475 [Nitrospirae bacterium RBG_16_64_22]|nr:MAG: hypothetical protein A2V83_07475 [Nitrospirae bacterium RBG_16_64_22]
MHLPPTKRTSDEWVAEMQAAFRESSSACRKGGRQPGPEWFQSLDAWANQMMAVGRFDAAEEALSLALDAGARRFPSQLQAIRATEAALCTLTGRHRKAAEIGTGYAMRSYLHPDRKLRPILYQRVIPALLLTGQMREYLTLLWRGLADVYRNPDVRDWFMDEIGKTYGGFWRAVLRADVSAGHRMALALLSMQRVTRRTPALNKTVLPALLYSLALGFLYVLKYGWPGLPSTAIRGQSGKRADKILVTRAMGGIGDLLMMTPALAVLHARHPDKTIHFAVPEEFFPLFEGNTDVVCVDIESPELDPNDYGLWFDFTDCPAARVETMQAPNVRKDRIEIFARALGVRTLARSRPVYVVVEGERERAGNRLTSLFGRTNRPLIGLQMRSAESYRDYPHMARLATLLAAEANVVAFHSDRIDGIESDGCKTISGLPIREVAALIERCDLVIAPDSAFVHLAAALDRPCLTITGPTDGRLRGRFGEAIVPGRNDYPCAPCWRNEEKGCRLTGGKESLCLASISPEHVRDACRKHLRKGSPADMAFAV